MGLGQVDFRAGVSAEGAGFLDRFLVDELEFRERGRFALILRVIEEGLPVGFVFLGVDVLFVGLRGHKLFGAYLTVDFGVALTGGGKFSLELCVWSSLRKM